MRRLQLCKSKRGMTLVEMVVGIAILSLLFLFIVSVFPTAITIVGQQASLKRSTKDAAAGLEESFADLKPAGSVIINETPGQLELQFPAGSLNPDGVYLDSKDADGGVLFHYFDAD